VKVKKHTKKASTLLKCIRRNTNNKGETFMSILANLHLQSNTKIKINFNGGNLSSDAGLLLLHEFVDKLGLHQLLKNSFKTTDKAKRQHLDDEILLQKIYQFCSGYFTDNVSDELSTDPVFTTLLGKKRLASQPTISRFGSRLDEITLEQLHEITCALRKRIYSVVQPPRILLDLDSTLLPTYGKQEGEAFNYHYSAHGYHPLVCYDGFTGDLLKIELRKGNTYSSTGVQKFLQPLLDEYLNQYPDTELFLRGDSGFATPELYTQAESNGCSYAIRLKNNRLLRELAFHLEEEVTAKAAVHPDQFVALYGEFSYQAGSWNYARRVICKIEKRPEELFVRHTFIVTNMALSPQDLVRFYCNRGRMENFIKESKNEFCFAMMSSHSMLVNSNRLQICMLAYNLFNWFRRLCLPGKMKKFRADTIRLKFLKIAGKLVKSARTITFKLCSSCPYIREFYETFKNIDRLRPKLE
jgi:hypothetical protein